MARDKKRPKTLGPSPVIAARSCVACTDIAQPAPILSDNDGVVTQPQVVEFLEQERRFPIEQVIFSSATVLYTPHSQAQHKRTFGLSFYL